LLFAGLLFVVITYRKVSLWLWKSLENLGNFFSYLVATLYAFSSVRARLVCHYCAFGKANISQGSVATPLSCVGICNNHFIANFLLLCICVGETVLKVGQYLEKMSLDKSLMFCFFDSRCIVWQFASHAIIFS